MSWIKSGTENPSKSEIIGSCGRTNKSRTLKKKKKKKKHLKLHHNNKTQDLFVQTTGFQGIHVTVVLDGQ